jgi:hypothetical protein
MTIACPDCNTKLKAREEWIGKKATCKGCGCEFTIKTFVSEPAVQDQRLPPRSDGREQRTQPKKNNDDQSVYMPTAKTNDPPSSRRFTKSVAALGVVIGAVFLIGRLPGVLLIPVAGLCLIIAGSVAVARKNKTPNTQTTVVPVMSRETVGVLLFVGLGVLTLTVIFIANTAQMDARRNGTAISTEGAVALWIIDVATSPWTWLFVAIGSALGYLKIIAKNTQVQRIPCPVCGELIAISAIKCRFCGAPTNPSLQ